MLIVTRERSRYLLFPALFPAAAGAAAAAAASSAGGAETAPGSKPPLSPIEMLPYDLLDLIGEQIPLLSIEVAARVRKQRAL